MSIYSVEVRPNDDGTVDEVIIRDDQRVIFHLEQMADDAYWFGIYHEPEPTDERYSFWLGRKKKAVTLHLEEEPAQAVDAREGAHDGLLVDGTTA